MYIFMNLKKASYFVKSAGWNLLVFWELYRYTAHCTGTVVLVLLCNTGYSSATVQYIYEYSLFVCLYCTV